MISKGSLWNKPTLLLETSIMMSLVQLYINPQRSQQPPTLLMDSQDSQLASPQPVIPQHCQHPTILPNSQDVDNLSPIIDLQHNLQPTVAVTPQPPVSAYDAEQPPPVQTSSKRFQQFSTAFLSKKDFQLSPPVLMSQEGI